MSNSAEKVENGDHSVSDFDKDEDVWAEIPTKRWEEALTPKGLKVVDYGGLVTLAPESKLIAKNWSLKKKLTHTILYGLTTCSGQLCTSIISPGIPQISQELHVGTEVATLAFSIFVVGNMVGPPIFAPMSELYGRKIGVFIPTFLAGGAMVICANVTSIAALTVFRFLGGVLAAAPIVNAPGAMGDMWAVNVLVSAIVLYVCSLVLGAVSAPIFGALLVNTGDYGWRWACWLAGLTTMAISFVNMFILSESFHPTVEQRATQKVRLATGFWALHVDHDKWAITLKEFTTVHLMRPVLMLATPIVLLMNLFAAFIYGLFFLIITSVGYEFQTVHHFQLVTSYLPLFGFFIGLILGGLFNIIIGQRYTKIAQTLKDLPPPEERLMAMLFGSWLMPCGMFVYGWTMKPWIHWIVPTIGLGMVGAGFLIIFQGCLMYLVTIYLKYIASVMGSNTILRSIFGGVFPLFAFQMYRGLGVHWASSLLGFVSLALCVLPYFFYIFGARIRNHDPFKNMIEK